MKHLGHVLIAVAFVTFSLHVTPDAQAEELETFQMEGAGSTEHEAREDAEETAKLLCRRNANLTRAVMTLPGTCRHEGSGYRCHAMRFNCAVPVP